MLMFRSKSKYRPRRFSNELNIYKQMQLNPEKINFYAVSFVLLVLITSLSSRYGKWILFTYGLIFMIVTTMSYCTKIRDCLYDEIANIKGKITQWCKRGRQYSKSLLNHVDKIERQFLMLNNIFATLCQIVFFSICEKILIPGPNVTALYSLMFYNVLSYCISYMGQMLSTNQWSPYINVADHSKIKHLAMSATKIVLEVTKAVTFVITIGFMLFVLCLEQRMHHYQPTKLFALLTVAYYLATESMFAEHFPTLLTRFQISRLENLETLWAPVLLSVISQGLSFCFAFALLTQGAYPSAAIALYLNVYLSYKKLTEGSWKILNEEKKAVSQFRYATKSELDEFEDVCAVCLTDMKLARITPCHHIFHTDCLRQCLLNCDSCPVCKRELKFL